MSKKPTEQLFAQAALSMPLAEAACDNMSPAQHATARRLLPDEYNDNIAGGLALYLTDEDMKKLPHQIIARLERMFN